MIVPVTEDQAVFVETAARFLDDTCSPAQVRASDGFSRTWWAQAAELGWTSPLVPEELGGGSPSGQGLLDLVHVAEQLGRHAAPGPFVTTSAALSVLGPAHADVIAAVLSGAAVLSWCPDTGVAEAGADYFLTGGRLVPAAEVRVEPLESIDLTRRLVRVSATGTEGEPAAGDPLCVAAVLQSAEAVGAAERVFEFTLEYAAERYSFGRPLSSYQALKHRFADMTTALEAARGVVAGAATALQEGDPRAPRIVSAAKAWTGEVLPALVQDCVQLHGGIGVTWEHDLHLYLRRVMLARSLYGTPAVHRRLLAVA
jgi:alkylation response protein AidB-like acyl-CoA dehydrogenase